MSEPGQLQPPRDLDKLLLIGHGGVGKKELINERAPKLPDAYGSWWAKTEGHIIRVLDTDIRVTLDELRGTGCCGLGEMTTEVDQWMYYPNTSAFVVCFDVTDPYSLDEVKRRWIPEIKWFYRAEAMGSNPYSHRTRESADRIRGLCMKKKMPPFLLVGLRIDQRKEAMKGVITPEEGKKLAEKFGAKMYLECSAKTGEGVDEVFMNAARLALLAADEEPLPPKRWSSWIVAKWQSLFRAD